MNKTIWICWFQGEDDPLMPEVNQHAVARWRELNPDYQVVFLSEKNIADFAPEYYPIVADSPKRTHAARSDLLRILLLSKFGGTWVDSSVYPMQPLSKFHHEILNHTGFFAYRHHANPDYLTTSSWFLTTPAPGHYLIEQWKREFIKVFKFNVPWDVRCTGASSNYFSFHHTLTRLYKTDARVKNIIDSMVQIDQLIPHSACFAWNFRVESHMYKRPVFTTFNTTHITQSLQI